MGGNDFNLKLYIFIVLWYWSQTMLFLWEAIKSLTPKPFSICNLLNIKQLGLGLR